MTPPVAQIAPAVDAAERLGSASAQVVLAAVALALCAVVVWLWRDNVRLNRECLSAQESRRADTERLLTVQVSRESGVVTAMAAITVLPEIVRELPDAVREVVRDELARAGDAVRGGRR